ncbi:hypothetical protein AVEN_170880-1 [Araneus ventricosus]|uniref:Uncharacterized protein n=1 Tax=Araneus ventricosus TaxID=182803 RepID=A0A4Y2T1D2_ARAVE|nr:hypothetical protein AVEN_170880-1 [Araneus ventricosus]
MLMPRSKNTTSILECTFYFEPRSDDEDDNRLGTILSKLPRLGGRLTLDVRFSIHQSHTHSGYCPTARRKTLRRVASNRRIEERRDTDIKSTATFGNLSELPLGEELVFERNTKRNETSACSIYAK